MWVIDFFFLCAKIAKKEKKGVQYSQENINDRAF